MEAYALTDVGVLRAINQDYVYFSQEPVGKLSNLFVVADGMGGHKSGEFASKYTVETVVKQIEKYQGEGPISILKDAVTVANSKLIEKSAESEEYVGMGTTLVIATIKEKSLYVANVGDSRLYVLDNDLSQITRDHSYVEEMVDVGEMKREDEDYRLKKNIITRAIGAAKDIMADFFEIQLKPGNTILMCSDGLTGMVSDEQIKEILMLQEDVKSKVQRLIDTANKNGGKDNIGIVLIQL